MDRITCDKCGFWESSNGREGLCHFWPHVGGRSGEFMTFPPISANGWCGQGKTKEPPQKTPWWCFWKTLFERR